MIDDTFRTTDLKIGLRWFQLQDRADLEVGGTAEYTA